MDIEVMVLDLIYFHNFHCQLVNRVKNGVIFGVENSSSSHTDNRKKDMLVLRKGPTDGWEMK